MEKKKNFHCLLLAPFGNYNFPHGKIMKLVNIDPDHSTNYAIVAVRDFDAATQILDCYAFFIHEETGRDKLFIADEQSQRFCGKILTGVEIHIGNRVGMDLSQGWKIASGLMDANEMAKLLESVEIAGYVPNFSITYAPIPIGCQRFPVADACMFGPFERIKKKKKRNRRRRHGSRCSGNDNAQTR